MRKTHTRVVSVLLSTVMILGMIAASGNLFTVKGAETMMDKVEISVPAGKQVEYSNRVQYVSGKTVVAKLEGEEMFSISSSGMKICGSTVKGSYQGGEYGLCIYVNPEQKILCVEVTLPDGGIVRRGKDTKLQSGTITVEADGVGVGTVTYTDITEKAYSVVNVEPISTGFKTKVYNIVTSFEDAATTRYFSWTARASFAGSAELAIKYRAAGVSDWTVIDARRLTETTKVAAEDYFKAELTGLTPNTSYEYKIGKKGSTDETKDWSDTYGFKTASEDIGDFSFIAIGDSQSNSWSSGYSYSMASIDSAMQEAYGAAFIVNVGDMVNKGSVLDQWNWYFKSLGDYAYSVPHFATIGNHDVWTADTKHNATTSDKNNYFSLHLNHPDNGENAINASSASGVQTDYAKLLVNNYEDTIYSYNYGSVHFVVLNSGSYNDSDDAIIQRAQREWLEADLQANADAKWTVVIQHEATYSRLGGNESRPYLSDIFDEYGVDLVIQGHSHLVTRTYPMKDGKIVTKQNPDTVTKGTGTVYSTIGSTARNHDSIGNPNIEECMLVISPESDQPAYTVVSLQGNELKVTIKQLNGYVLDSFSIIGEDDAPTSDDNGSAPAESTPISVETEQPKKGCKSTIGGSALALATGVAAVAVRKKKRKNS